MTVAEFRKATNDVLGRARDSDPVPADAARRISELAKASTEWKPLKRAGLSALNGTPAYTPAMRLTATLARLGAFVVPVGELESWVPSVSSGDKSKWLTTVFEDRHHLKPSDQLKTLCAQIRAYLQDC
ncbi:hypothetical protein [Streptomyces sp. NPDC001568]|uniref:hypothetical protein n=1 Tax=Streptomyces sp. NPDC001568 TaxID=3364588 RepID=UPI0036868450